MQTLDFVRRMNWMNWMNWMTSKGLELGYVHNSRRKQCENSIPLDPGEADFPDHEAWKQDK